MPYDDVIEMMNGVHAEILEDVFRYNLGVDQNGVDRIEEIAEKYSTYENGVPQFISEVDGLLTFYRDVLTKESPGAYCLYDTGDGPFLVAKNMVEYI